MKRVLVLLLAIVFVFGAAIVPASDVSFAKKRVKAPVKVTGVSIVLKKDINLTVKWHKAKRAKKYQVYMKAGKSKWKKVKTTTKRVYKIKGKYNTKYSFKIRGLRGKKRGKFSAVSSTRTHEKPVPIIVEPEKDEDEVTIVDEEQKDEEQKDEEQKDEEKKDEEQKDGENQDEGTPAADTNVGQAITLIESQSHFDKEFKSDEKVVVRKSTRINVKVIGAKGKILSWYQIPQNDSYDNPELLRVTDAFASNKGEATFYVTEGKKEKYIYCSFIADDGTEMKSEIFTVPAIEI